jgi:hypothetical protein
MTVRDLIAKLQEFHPDLPVLVNGYEGGLVDLTTSHVYTARVAFHHRSASYMGPHEELYSDDDPSDEWSPYHEDAEEGRVRSGVVLSRRERL